VFEGCVGLLDGVFYLFGNVEEDQQCKKAKTWGGLEGGCGGHAGVCAGVSAVFLAFKRVLHCSQLSKLGLRGNSSGKRQENGEALKVGVG
jgi:hypothetical protein